MLELYASRFESRSDFLAESPKLKSADLGILPGNGVQLDEEQQKYIDGLAQKEQKRRSDKELLREYVEHGLCPSDYFGPAGLACKYIEQHLEGKIDRKRLDHILSRYKTK